MRVKTLIVAALIAASGSAALSITVRTPVARQEAEPYTLLTRDGRRTLTVRRANGQDMFVLDQLAAVFALTVREDTLAGDLTVSVGGRTIVLSPGQTLASVGGRLISLPAPAVREGATWLVPIDFVGRALATIVGAPIEVRKPPRLVIVGDLSVPRVSLRLDAEDPARARLTFEVDPPTPHTVSRQNDRLVVGFEADTLDPRLGVIPPNPLVAGVRLGEFESSVVINLGPAFASFRTVDTVGDDDARVVIELAAASPESTPPGPPAPVTAESVTPPLVDFTSPGTLRAIVIDPGHGGTEEGARGANGTLEKEVTLAVARRLASAIERRLGVRVILTRDGDQTVALDERAARANNNKADLFISLHAGGSLYASAAGAQIFSLGLEAYGSQAERAASAAGSVLPVFGGNLRSIEFIPWEMAQARYLDESGAFAAMVEDALRERVPMSPRARQRGPFRVLVGANMPAVLVEMGFLSNPSQEQALTSDSFQNAVTAALLESIIRFRAYLRTHAPSTPVAAPAADSPGAGSAAMPLR